MALEILVMASLGVTLAAASLGPAEDFLKDPYILLGWGGAALFGTRFIIQWLASEKKKESVMPESFWWISLAASFLTIAYYVHLWNIKLEFKEFLPLVIMPSGGIVPYIRNLMLIHRKKKQAASSPPTTSPTP